MNAESLSRGLPIGSGSVESAAKNIVEAPLKRRRVRWSRDGGQHPLDLRAHHNSERWEPIAKYSHERCMSCPDPTLTRSMKPSRVARQMLE